MIQKIKGCHNCDAYATETPTKEGNMYCSHPRGGMMVTGCVERKSLHDKCPLEDEDGVILSGAEHLLR